MLLNVVNLALICKRVSIKRYPLRWNSCVLVYRYTKEGNINELRHNSMYGYENNRNSLVYRYTRTAPLKSMHSMQAVTDGFEVRRF